MVWEGDSAKEVPETSPGRETGVPDTTTTDQPDYRFGRKRRLTEREEGGEGSARRRVKRRREGVPMGVRGREIPSCVSVDERR